MNELKHLAEFQNALGGYKISAQSKKILDEVKLALFLAPTSAGRNTIIRELVKTGDFYYIVSDTTRKPRVNDGVLEQNGVEYWFRTEEEILEDLKQGKFLEAEVIHRQQVSGISMRELEKAKNKGKIAVTDIDLQGVVNVVSDKPDTIVFLILPPSFEEWQKRIKGRGEMTKGEYLRRMETAQKIFAAALTNPNFIIVISDELQRAVKAISAAAKTGKIDEKEQKYDHELIKDFYQKTK